MGSTVRVWADSGRSVLKRKYQGNKAACGQRVERYSAPLTFADGKDTPLNWVFWASCGQSVDAFVEIVAGEARERPHAFWGPAVLFIIMKCVPNLRVKMEAAACHPLGLFRATAVSYTHLTLPTNREV